MSLIDIFMDEICNKLKGCVPSSRTAHLNISTSNNLVYFRSWEFLRMYVNIVVFLVCFKDLALFGRI